MYLFVINMTHSFNNDLQVLLDKCLGTNIGWICFHMQEQCTKGPSFVDFVSSIIRQGYQVRCKWRLFTTQNCPLKDNNPFPPICFSSDRLIFHLSSLLSSHFIDSEQKGSLRNFFFQQVSILRYLQRGCLMDDQQTNTTYGPL